MNSQPEAPKRLTRDEAKSQTRERLLESASRVFVARGFAGASVEEIAESAGYSIGALYSNFDSKEQLFLELMSARRVSRLATLMEELSSAKDGSRHYSLEELPNLLLDVTENDADFSALQSEFLRFANRNPELKQHLVEQVEERTTALERLVTKVLDQEGVDEPSAHDVTVAVMALTQGLMRRRRIERSAVSDELFVRALGWLLEGVRHS